MPVALAMILLLMAPVGSASLLTEDDKRELGSLFEEHATQTVDPDLDDDTPPELTIDDAVSWVYPGMTLDASGQAHDDSEVIFVAARARAAGGDPVTPWKPAALHSGGSSWRVGLVANVSEGSYRIDVMARDLAGNNATASVQVNVTDPFGDLRNFSGLDTNLTVDSDHASFSNCDRGEVPDLTTDGWRCVPWDQKFGDTGDSGIPDCPGDEVPDLTSDGSWICVPWDQKFGGGPGGSIPTCADSEVPDLTADGSWTCVSWEEKLGSEMTDPIPRCSEGEVPDLGPDGSWVCTTWETLMNRSMPEAGCGMGATLEDDEVRSEMRCGAFAPDGLLSPACGPEGFPLPGGGCGLWGTVFDGLESDLGAECVSRSSISLERRVVDTDCMASAGLEVPAVCETVGGGKLASCVPGLSGLAIMEVCVDAVDTEVCNGVHTSGQAGGADGSDGGDGGGEEEPGTEEGTTPGTDPGGSGEVCVGVGDAGSGTVGVELGLGQVVHTEARTEVRLPVGDRPVDRVVARLPARADVETMQLCYRTVDRFGEGIPAPPGRVVQRVHVEIRNGSGEVDVDSAEVRLEVPHKELPPDAENVSILHFDGQVWQVLSTEIDAQAGGGEATLTLEAPTGGFSPFAVAYEDPSGSSDDGDGDARDGEASSSGLPFDLGALLDAFRDLLDVVTVGLLIAAGGLIGGGAALLRRWQDGDGGSGVEDANHEGGDRSREDAGDVDPDGGTEGDRSPRRPAGDRRIGPDDPGGRQGDPGSSERRGRSPLGPHR